ncbi:MAG TPA: TonB family protein [Desulfuromonadaceae bacterium]|nr:TonB family protein [Desulfuromonadaceae bacterium]
MSRLQKKCVLGTAIAHLLLFGCILIANTGFFERRQKAEDATIFTVIPANVLDNAINMGTQGAPPPPPPAPPTPPKPAAQIKPTPPPPQPVKAPDPTPSLMDRMKKYFNPPAKPTPTQTKPDDHKVQPNLTKVTRTKVNPTPNKAAQKALDNLRKNLNNKGTQISLAPNSAVATANYATVVRSVYDNAWILPDKIANDNENVTVSVTIARDGTVISSRIVTPSGDGPVDASVQQALDRVNFVAAFPEGSTDKERTYTIVYNPQLKKSE